MALADKNAERDGGIGEDNEHLERVGNHQIIAVNNPQGGDNQQPCAGLNEPTVDADKKEHDTRDDFVVRVTRVDFIVQPLCRIEKR